MFNFKKKKIKCTDRQKIENIKKYTNHILLGPLSRHFTKSDSNEYMYDGFSLNEYEDNILNIKSFSGQGIGKGHISGSTRITLKNFGTVFDGENAYNIELWYDYLVNIYNKSVEIKTRNNNLYHKVINIFKYFPSGYSDGIIKIEYISKPYQYYSSSENEYLETTFYTGSIYLIPKKEYVFFEDNINYKNDSIHRPGKWVDYVCSLIDEKENEKKQAKKLQLRKGNDKQLIKIKNTEPIDDSDIF